MSDVFISPPFLMDPTPRIGSFVGVRLQMEDRTEASDQRLVALEGLYKGILAVNLSTYKVARSEPPLFERKETLDRLAKTDLVLCLVPSTNALHDPIQTLYESYTNTKRVINVYECQYKIYSAIDKVAKDEFMDLKEILKESP